MLGSRINESMIPQHINFTQVSPEDYQLMFERIKGFHGSRFNELGLEICNIENELNKVSAEMRVQLVNILSNISASR